MERSYGNTSTHISARRFLVDRQPLRAIRFSGHSVTAQRRLLGPKASVERGWLQLRRHDRIRREAQATDVRPNIGQEAGALRRRRGRGAGFVTALGVSAD